MTSLLLNKSAKILVGRTPPCPPLSTDPAKHLVILYNPASEEVINGEMKNVRLFHDDTFQSFFRRMDMSPDGQLLVIPSGVLEIDGEATVKNCTYVFSRTDLSR